MKKTIVVLCLLAMVACDKGKPVDNKAESTYELMLIAETPEKVKVYRIYGNGTIAYLSVTEDGKSVAMSQH